MKTILNEDFSCVMGVMTRELGHYPTGEDVRRYARILKSGGIDTVMINPCGQISYIPSETVEDYESRYRKTEIDGIPVSVDEYAYTSAGKAKYNAALKSGRAPQFVASDFNENSIIVLGGFAM